MIVINDTELRKVLGINKDVPVYYLSASVTSSSLRKNAAQIGEDFDKKFPSMDISEMIDKRPFDECVIITSDLKNEKDVYSIIHFLEDGNYRHFLFSRGEFTNLTIRETFDILKFSPEQVKRDQEQLEKNKMACFLAISPFCIKKNIVNLAEGRTIKSGKKGKVKKQKFLYVTSSIYEASESKNQVKINSSYEITKVAGHPRYFRKKPDTEGHDRKGNKVIGWTWVSPYKRGEGLEIINKIRKYLR